MAQHADLEIRVLKLEPDGYPVEFTLNKEREFTRGFLSPGILPWKSLIDPVEIIQKLYEWFFADERVQTAWAEMRGIQTERRIRLRIDASAPELHLLPWELLSEKAESGVLQTLSTASATPFSRYLAGQWAPGSPVFKRPLKILVAIANPTNLKKDYDLEVVDEGKEWDSLAEAVKELKAELSLLPAPVSLPTLEAKLREGYHVLHFIGHGAFHPEKGAFLFMADEHNQAQRVLEVDFAAMLSRQMGDPRITNEDRLRLVFLSSCQSATRSPADALRGFAPALVAAGVPAVVAMQDLVPVLTAQAFARTFYHELLQHGLVDLASNQARSALISAAPSTDAAASTAAIPVLFSRLRENNLVGQRGLITGAKQASFWPFLLEKIRRKECIPMLGPRITSGLLPDRASLSEALAQKYNYPFTDQRNLARVAQFVDVYESTVLRSEVQRYLRRNLFSYLEIQPSDEQKRRFRDASLTETTEALGWAERVLTLQEDVPHHLLAELRLPLYVTTNLDNFMSEALKQQGLSPRRLGPKWVQAEAGELQYALIPEPSPEQPVVFHLNGHDGDQEQYEHQVLTEDDYLAYFVQLSREQDQLLPMNVTGMFFESSFLFLGYSLDDWEFRLLLQGLLKPIAQTRQASKMHVGVQLTMEQNPNQTNAMEYLEKYLGQFDITIYWGTARQFVSELYSHWQADQERADDDW